MNSKNLRLRDASDDLDGEGLIYPNGVDITTGRSGEPIAAGTLARIATGEMHPEVRNTLIKSRKHDDEEGYGVVYGVNPNDVAETGWCVVFAQNAEPAIKEALQPLLELRKEQTAELYRECSDFNLEEDLSAFLRRFGAAPGEAADPKKLPYYVLLVGDPISIPFEFQSQLDVTYAVGRICFNCVDEYRAYAKHVVLSESGEAVAPKRALFLGTRNPGDRPTRRSSDMLVKPLSDSFEEEHRAQGWTVERRIGDDATKTGIAPFIGGVSTPGLLFTATHGAKVPFDSHLELQLRDQGALICQDWGGPFMPGPLSSGQYFAAADISPDASFPGTVAFLFACYGAGTPEFDDFASQDAVEQERIASHPFIARLPQVMLAKGALAVVGHVDRAWGYSFNWPLVGAQYETFRGTVAGIAEGQPVGAALDSFNVRYAALSALLLEEIRQHKLPLPKQNDSDIAGLWTATTDARNYVLLGDPAVRLRV